MYYAMRLTEGVATRYGRLTRNLDTAKRAARRCGGYVEKYGFGVVWVPARTSWLPASTTRH